MGNRPNRILLAKKLNPYTMGALLSYFENTVAFQGFIWNINSFDQEGVQLGKVLANKIIEILKGTKDADKAFPLGKTLLDELDKIK
jgi:glucose-6-phosphate isomerase